MSSKRSSGSARNGRDSAGKRLGVKAYDGEYITSGSIIVRQRGTRIHPGENVRTGRDHTLFSIRNGIVKFEKQGRQVRVVEVVPATA